MNKEYVVELPDSVVKDLSVSIFKSQLEDLKNSIPMMANRARVGQFDGLKVEVFSNEHAPPHFRVVKDGRTANFRINDCSVLNGDREILRFQKNIFYWWKENKAKIIEKWNNFRPTDCPVGFYREEAA